MTLPPVAAELEPDFKAACMRMFEAARAACRGEAADRLRAAAVETCEAAAEYAEGQGDHATAGAFRRIAGECGSLPLDRGELATYALLKTAARDWANYLTGRDSFMGRACGPIEKGADNG